MPNALPMGFLLLLLAGLPGPPGARAAVEGEVTASLPLDAAPLDVAVSADERWIFVLVQGGEVRVYAADGRLQGTLRVGKGAERIAASATGDRLFVAGASPDRVDIVAVDFVHPIDVAGSPFRGAPDAPVVVAVYNDFQ